LLLFHFQNSEITSAVQKVAESYKCKPIEGMLSHQLKQFKIDGEKTIIQNPNEGQRKEHDKHKFETYEVYAIDVLISTGEGQVGFLFTFFCVFLFYLTDFLIYKKYMPLAVSYKNSFGPFIKKNFKGLAKSRTIVRSYKSSGLLLGS